MRIIGGKFKGRHIEIPKGADIRPTSDKVREALFNIIKDRTEGASVLDLFAGSGSLGIEALSRGAEKATFIDIQARCISSIRKNLKSLAIKTENIELLQENALKAIKKLSESKIRFNLVFLDPPYYGDWIKKCLIYLDEYDILYNSHIIICEHFKKDIVPEKIGRFKKVKRSSYGDTVLTFYETSGISGDV